MSDRERVDEQVRVARSGLPVASWLAGRDELHVASGTAGGRLRESTRVQRVRGITGDHWLAADRAGDIIFWYVTGLEPGPHELLMRVSTDGRPFGLPRLVARIPGTTPSALVVAGGDSRSLLALWSWWDKHDNPHRRASLGGIARQFAKPTPIGPGSVGFLAGHGEALVAYEQRLPGYDSAGLLENFRVDFSRATPGHPFGRPRPLAPSLRNCAANLGGREVATSATGYAILYLTCQDGSQYMVRYTP
jgi:hypothetical protein